VVPVRRHHLTPRMPRPQIFPCFSGAYTR
jgi:hypothetical protein